MKSVITFFLLTVAISVQNSFAQSASTFINEINYLASNPTDAGLEIAGEAGSNLAGWSVVGYALDGTVDFVEYISEGVIPNQQNGYGTFWYDVEQNSTGGGLALVNAGGNVVQFLSYGTINFAKVIITAVEGEANGMKSKYVGTQLLPQNSLQLIGTGLSYADFLWSLPIGGTPGGVNTTQLFGLLPPLFAVSQPNGQQNASLNAQPTAYQPGTDYGSSSFDVVVFPNPTTDFIQVRLKDQGFADNELAEVGIFDRMGRMVVRSKMNTGAIQFDMSDFVPGQYTVRIETAGHRFVKKVFKQ